MHYSARLSLLPALIASAFPLYAADTADGEHYTATLPTVTVVGQSDTSVLKGGGNQGGKQGKTGGIVHVQLGR